MTEERRSFSDFDGEHLSSFLAATTQETKDFTHGTGQALHIADGQTLLEVFPSGIVRVTTEEARVEVLGVSDYTLNTERGHVVFEHGKDRDRSRLVVRDTGKVSFYPVLKAVEGPKRPKHLTTTAKDGNKTPAAPETTTRPVAPVQDSGGKDQEVEPVTLQGRLGRDPWFAQQDDSPVAGFPLAENLDKETRWHKVVVFDDTAAKLQEQVKTGDICKGRLVEVTGESVTREEKTNRSTKRTTEFHATNVKRVKATRSRPVR